MANKLFNFSIIGLTAVFSIAFFSLFGAEAYDGMLSAAVSRMPACQNSVMLIIPDGATKVRLPDATGKVLNFETGLEITGLTPDTVANKIYFSGTKEVGIIYAPWDCYPKFGYVFLAQMVADPVVTPPVDSSLPAAVVPPVDSVPPANTAPPADSTQSFGTTTLETPIAGTSTVGTSTIDTPQAPPPAPALTPVLKEFSDVKEDHAYRSSIMKIVKIMLEKFTYSRPNNDKFGANTKTNATFAMQIIAAVSGAGCGSETQYPGRAACRAFLVEKGIIDDQFPTNIMNRFTFYKYLLKAKSIALVDVDILDAVPICTDQVRWSKEMAQVLVTARKYGLAAIYAGQKCNLLKPFSRSQATSFVAKFLKKLSTNL
jgi:hypothetical protein